MLRELVADRIRTSGPISFAEYMELSLYHPELGYYARAAQKTGRAGDFFTSVDVGPIFGELLAKQFAEMWRVMAKRAREPFSGRSGKWLPTPFRSRRVRGRQRAPVSRHPRRGAPQRPGVLFRHPALSRRAVPRRARGPHRDPRPACAPASTQRHESAGARLRRHPRQRTARRAAHPRRRHDGEWTARSVRRYLRRPVRGAVRASLHAAHRGISRARGCGDAGGMARRSEPGRRRLDDAGGRRRLARGFWSSSTTATTSASSTAFHTRQGR